MNFQKLQSKAIFIHINRSLFKSDIKVINNSRYLQRFYSSNKAISSYTNKKTSYATTSNINFNLLSETIKDLLEKREKETPNALAFAFPHNGGLNLTFSELAQRVRTMAESLLKLGFKKGDKFAIVLPNTNEFVITLLACASIGVITVSLNPGYQYVEIEYMLKKTKAKGILVYDTFKTLNHYDILKKLCPQLDHSNPGEINSSILPDLKHVVIINSPLSKVKNEYKGTWKYNDLANGKINGSNIVYPETEMDDPFLILFTSGTTGYPKGVQLKQIGVLNCVHHACVSSFGNDDGFKTSCVPIPLFHLYGLAMGLVNPLVSGASSVFSFFLPDTLSSMKAIQAYKCHSYIASPTLFIDLVNHPERKKFDLSSLQNTIIGASTVPSDLLVKMKSELNIKKVVVGYGMTETSLLATQTVHSDSEISFKKAFESIGRPIGFIEAKIINKEDGKIIPLNTDGELCLRGFNIIREYLDEPKKSLESIDKNGWFKTGDICSMDEDGYIYFKSRTNDVIIRGGTNIYPAEVEAYLRTNPKIVDACVFGIPDERLGEDVGVWIRLQPNTTFNIDELKEYCKDKIAYFKIPKYMKIVESIPINPNGKVMRNKIIEIVKNEINK